MFRESFDVYNLFCPCFDGLLVITCQQPSFQGGKGNCVLRNDYELNTAIISSPIHNVNSLINIQPSPQWRPHSLLRLSAYNKYNMHHENPTVSLSPDGGENVSKNAMKNGMTVAYVIIDVSAKWELHVFELESLSYLNHEQ